MLEQLEQSSDLSVFWRCSVYAQHWVGQKAEHVESALGREIRVGWPSQSAALEGIPATVRDHCERGLVGAKVEEAIGCAPVSGDGRGS